MNIKLNKPFAADSAVDEFDVRQTKKGAQSSGILSTLRKNRYHQYSRYGRIFCP